MAHFLAVRKQDKEAEASLGHVVTGATTVYMLYAIGLSYDNRRKGYLFMSQYRGWTRDIKLPK